MKPFVTRYINMNSRLYNLGVKNRILSRDVLFKHPFNMVISGGSYGGKTQFTWRLIKNIHLMIDTKYKKILYCYGIFDPRLFEMKSENDNFIEFHEGVPTIEYLRSQDTPMLLVLDDLMKESARSGFLDAFFTKGSHHLDISVILITQDIFFKDMKTARNNAHYIVLMRNPSGERQIRDLATQLFPGRKRSYFMEAKESALRENWSYLFIDMHPASRDDLRLRTNIFPGEVPVLFIQRDAS